MPKYFYVYLLRSKSDPNRRYTSLSDDLNKRITIQNAVQVSHTAKFRSRELEAAIAFISRQWRAEFGQSIRRKTLLRNSMARSTSIQALPEQKITTGAKISANHDGEMPEVCILPR